MGATKISATKSVATRRITAPKKRVARKPAPQDSQVSDDAAETPLEIEEYRQRLGAVGRLMRAALTDLETQTPISDRIGQGAYLQVMGRAFEVLDGLSQTIEVDDLVKISKVVAEQRRAELNHRKLQLVSEATGSRTNSNGEVGPKNFELPESFGEIVRQIYGTTLAVDMNEAGGGLGNGD